MAMGVRDVGFRVHADGAVQAATDMEKVAKAEEHVGRAATESHGPFGKLEGALEGVTGPAGKALRVFNDIGDVFKLTAAGLAGGALFGGLQDIAEAYKMISAAAGEALKSVDLSRGGLALTALEEHRIAAENAAKAEKTLSDAIIQRIGAQQAASAGAVGHFLDLVGSGATPEALARVSTLAAQRASFEQQRSALSLTVGQTGGTPEQIAELGRLQSALEGVNKELRDYTEMSPTAPTAPGGHGKVVKGPQAWWDLHRTDAQFFAAASANVDTSGQTAGIARGLHEFSKPASVGNPFADDGEVNSITASDIRQPHGVFSMLSSTDAEREQWNRDLADASEGLRGLEAQSAASAASGKSMGADYGHALAHVAAAALFTGASFRQLAHDESKSLAIRAVGEAVWEGAQGVANLALAVWGIPNAAAAAELHFQAAGMFAIIAAGSGAVAAATSGGGGHAKAGSRGSPGSSGSGFGGSSLAPDRNETPAINLTLLLDGAVVHQSVVRHEDDIRRTGSSSTPTIRRAVAA